VWGGGDTSTNKLLYKVRYCYVMDLLYYFFALIVAFIGCVIGAFSAVFLIQGYSFAQLNSKIARIENRFNAAAGVEVKHEKAERMSAAMAKVVLVMKDESIPKEEKTKALMSVAAEYPDVAFDLVKKVGLKGLL